MTGADMAPKTGQNDFAPFLITLALVVGTVFVIWCSTNNAAKILSGLLCIIVLIQFWIFLFAMAKQIGTRSKLAVSIYVVANIASVICLFGNLYRWIGFKDTVLTQSETLPLPLRDAIYFSTVTWTTLGYGDIVPIGDTRLIAGFEALAGYVTMSLLIVVLIEMVKQPSA